MPTNKLAIVNLSVPEPPNAWLGSKPEWCIYWALVQLGYQDGVDFDYQTSAFGGRSGEGGAVMDFTIPSLNLAINVQSVYFHYAKEGSRVHDEYVRVSAEQWGYNVIYIDEDDAVRDPIFYVKEAFMYIDHSLTVRGRGR
ncbi:hypothetical protein [Dehalococcoides mccartyi]|uniref:hypothetical protein n=1 Tax=Dehalococcoides mccartyi TaxID=61435 RepID=UPI00242B5022|nr:hypothetical protein [Dehalococcoides mccartyi]